MILIGQYDSPFVRRVGITMQLLGLAYEHRPWSTFGDAEKLRAASPLGRVPVLVLDDGTVLPDSQTILSYLDAAAGTRLIDAAGPRRWHTLRRAAFAMGVCDKAVALIYERVLHEIVSPAWMERCQTQIAGTLALLERERAAEAGAFWQGEAPGHDDIALGCAASFLAVAHPALLSGAYPAILAHAGRCEAMPVFQAVYQAFEPPRRH